MLMRWECLFVTDWLPSFRFSPNFYYYYTDRSSMGISSWQSKFSTVRERNLYAFDKSLFCDVEFSVLDSNGGRVILQAHKYVLAISSPVFEAMFYGELAETGSTIDLPDCTKEGLQEMLHYVYSDEVNLTGSSIMQVLYLAKKYMLPFLEQKCREYLEEQIKPEDVFVVLSHARQLLGDDKLEQHCWDMVERETERAVSSEPFLDVSHEVLCQVLGRDGLKIREVDLFKAVDKWVLKRIEEKGIEDSGENKRVILGEEAIRLIRFPLMSQKDFAEVVVPKVILNVEELSELFQIFNSLTPSKNIFSSKKRRAMLPIKSRFGRFVEPGTPWRYKNNKIDAIDFTVNKVVSLVGVRLFGSQGNSYNVDVTIYQNNDVLSLISSSFATEEVMTDDQYYGFTVTLDKPVPLDPGVRYSIVADIRGPTSYYGRDGQTTIHCEEFEIKYFVSEKSTNGTRIGSGQFVTVILV